MLADTRLTRGCGNALHARTQVREWCRGQVAVSVESHTGRVLDCSGVQLAGMLDDLFATDEPLGDHVSPATNTRAVSVWVCAASGPASSSRKR